MREREYRIVRTSFGCPKCATSEPPLKVAECNGVPVAYHCQSGHHFRASHRLADDEIIEIAITEDGQSFELGTVIPS